MSPITLTFDNQIAIGILWLLTITIACLGGSIREQERHIADLKSHIAFLTALLATEDQAAPLTTNQERG